MERVTQRSSQFAWVPDQERWMVDALFALFEANRVEGEAYAQCFQRVGAPGYAAYLTDLLIPVRALEPAGSDLHDGPDVVQRGG